MNFSDLALALVDSLVQHQFVAGAANVAGRLPVPLAARRAVCPPISGRRTSGGGGGGGGGEACGSQQ